MQREDVPATDAIWRAAFGPLRAEDTTPPEPRTREDEALDLQHFHHLLGTDPHGANVAEVGGLVVGFEMALRRGGQFVLSRLGVSPKYQNRGIGRALLNVALSYASGSSEQYIWSSRDPRALHSYVREGFVLRPTLRISGRHQEQTIPSSIRELGEQGLSQVDAIDQELRGLTRRADIEFWLRAGARLLIDDGGGYLLFRGTRLTALGATSIPVAERLLRSVLCGYRGHPPIEVGWVTAEQQWAVHEATSCGATLEVHGAMMARDVEKLPVPYLPNALHG
jgi:GNAT superfamily N-acetyltransferase